MWVCTGWCVYNADIKQNRTVLILYKEENCKLSTTESYANRAMKEATNIYAHTSNYQFQVQFCAPEQVFLGPDSLNFLLMDQQKN
jgi:hypothetical protein